MEKTNLAELIRQVNSEVERLEYTPNVVTKHKTVYRQLSDYAAEKGIEYYSEDLGERFLLDVFGLKSGAKSTEYTWQQAYSHAAIRKLGEYQAYGAFGKLIRRDDDLLWSLDDKAWVAEFAKSLDLLDVSKRSQHDRLGRIRKLYSYLGFSGITSVAQIDANVISRFVISLQGYSKTYIRHILKDLRSYFRFLHRHGHTEKDLSRTVPRVSVPQNANVPAIWTASDTNKLLSSVDRSTSVGKRDYAILLMMTELGLRSCDVNQLKLADINWQQKEIGVSQSKTGVMNVCPMSEELGWAVIDYIRDGRQKSDLPYLFLTANAPYTGFGASTARHILERYIKRSGISAKPMGVSRGTHSLRHSFARKLLNQNVPLDLISEIMGHTKIDSASPYLKVDIEGLRECALSVGEVAKHAEQAIL